MFEHEYPQVKRSQSAKSAKSPARNNEKYSTVTVTHTHTHLVSHPVHEHCFEEGSGYDERIKAFICGVLQERTGLLSKNTAASQIGTMLISLTHTHTHTLLASDPPAT